MHLAWRATTASAGRFLRDYRSLMLDQSPRFGDQLRREWRFCQDHPTIWLWGIALYVVGDWSLVHFLDMDAQRANGLVLGGFTLGYFLFRQWRLRQAHRDGSGTRNG